MLLIDGYNLLFALKKPDSRTLEQDRDELVRAIEGFAGRTNQSVRIVFDRGGPRRERRAGIEIVHVADGSSADDVILAALEETGDRTAYRVVSSDRAIRKAAERRKFEVVESREFWREVTALEERSKPSLPREKEQGISSAEADHWMKEFGLGGSNDQTRGSR